MLEWPAKRLHWQDMFGAMLPAGEIVYPRPLSGKSAYLEDREVIFVDLPVCETVHATAFYVPSARALIAGDLIYHGYHLYMADTNSPASWIAAIEQARGIGPIDTVFPGHGKFGGVEICAQAVRWLEDYRDVAKPGAHFTSIAKEMTQALPGLRSAVVAVAHAWPRLRHGRSERNRRSRRTSRRLRRYLILQAVVSPDGRRWRYQSCGDTKQSPHVSDCVEAWEGKARYA